MPLEPPREAQKNFHCCIEKFVTLKFPQNNYLCTNTRGQHNPRDGLDIFTDKDQQSIFLRGGRGGGGGLKFLKSIFCCVLIIGALFLVITKISYFSVFCIFCSVFRVQFYSPGTSVSKVLHHYHTVFNFY